MTKQQQAEAIVSQIRELFSEYLDPHLGSVSFNVRSYTTPEVLIHGIKTYDFGTEILRLFGVGDREKTVYEEGRCTLAGKSGDIGFTAFINELPPTCRLEKRIERIPKQQTVDTGDFIEVERVKVVCGAPQT